MTRAETRATRQRAQLKQRTVAGRGFTASFTYGDDDDALPTGDVTVEVFASSGESLHDAAASQIGDTGAYTAPLPVDALTTVDLLTLVWTAAVDDDTRTDVTTLDVCGSRLFTIGAMRRMPNMDNTEKYPNARVEAERIAAEDFLESQCKRAFAVRAYECQLNMVDWYVTSGLQLPTPDARTLLALSIDGEEIEEDALADYTLGGDGILYAPDAVTDVNVDATYVHGTITPDAGRVALILARHRLIHGPLDDRATALPVEGGGHIALLTPGVRGSRTGIPEVDAFIQEYE